MKNKKQTTSTSKGKLGMQRGAKFSRGTAYLFIIDQAYQESRFQIFRSLETVNVE